MLHPSSLQALMTMTLSNLVRVMCRNPDPVHYGPKKIDEQHVVNSMQQQQDCHFKRALVRLEPLLLLMVPQRLPHLLLQRAVKLFLALQTSWACFNLHIYACFSLYFLPNSCHSFFLLFIYLFFERAAANLEESMYTVCSNCGDSLQFKFSF